jgi:hypothetical protein
MNKIVKFLGIVAMQGLLAMVACAVDIPFTLDKPGNVSLAVYDAKGRVIRTLLRAEPMATGKHTVAWDGLDRDGKRLTGDFEWRLASSQRLKSEYLLSIGTSFREKHWPAQHGPLCAVESDGKRIYVTAGLSEGMPQTAAMTRDGGWQWVSGPTGGWMGGYDLALDGETLYFLGGPVTQPDARLFVQDATTGRMRQGGNDGLTNQTLWGTGGPLSWHVEGFDAPRRVEARDGELVLASPSTGLVVWLDPTTGKEVARTTIKGGVADIALLGGGRLLALTGDRLVETGRDGKPPVVRAEGLRNPQRLALDRTSGQLFVTEGGKSQQIKRFGGDYRLQKTFGRDGGRRTGRYKPQDFLEVSGIAGDGHGGFIVTETSAPRRTAHVDARGKLVDEWYGGQGFYTYVAPETDNPRRLWMHSQGWMTQLEADYKAGTWRPLATYRWDDALDRRLITGGVGNGGFGVKRLDRDGDGSRETYLWPKWSAPVLLKVDEEAGLLRPVAAVDTVPDSFGVLPPRSQTLLLAEPVAAPQWQLEAEVRWQIFNAHQHAWLEVLDAENRPIVSAYVYRGGPKPNVTSDAGHASYLVFNDREVMSQRDPHWGLTGGSQPVRIEVADGKAVFTLGNPLTGASVRLERPLLGGDATHPAAIRLREINSGRIEATKLRLATRRDGVEHPVAVQTNAVRQDAPVQPALLYEALRLRGEDADDVTVRRRYRSFAWTDADNDGRMQAGEIRLSAAGMPGSVLTMTDDFTVYLRSDAANGPDFRKLGPVEHTRQGYPVWNPEKLTAGPPTLFSQTRSLYVAGDGSIYQTSAYDGDGYNHNWTWPATFVNATAVVKTAPDGTMLWQAGERAARSAPPRGQMHYPINTLGVVQGCIGFADYIANPAEFWTEDGLYVGGVFDRRAEDGLHPRVYSWWRHDIAANDDWNNNLGLLQYDMLVGGNLVQCPDGQVLFFGAGWNNMPVYRITGWDGISRQSGKVAVPAAALGARRQGAGVRGAYFSNNQLSGEPALKRLDKRLWLGDGQPWPEELAPPRADPFSVRWTGFVEPPLHGTYTFSFYTADSGARLWIGGRKLLDQWSTPGKYWAKPVELEAGRLYPVTVEWRRCGKTPAFHLNWEALDLPVEHVPTAALYPELPAGVQPALLPPLPAPPPGTRRYEAVLDVRNETDTLELGIPLPTAGDWQLSGVAHFAVAHGGDTATFEIVDADGKRLVEWLAYRGDARAGVTRPRGHTNYLVLNRQEIEMDYGPSGNLTLPFTLHVSNGRVRLELPGGRVVERPVLDGDSTRPMTLRTTSRADRHTARVRIERITMIGGKGL